MYHEFAKDPVVQCLEHADQRHYVVILCLKCDGTLDRNISKANRDRLVYRGLGLAPADAEQVKKKLQELKLIDRKWQPNGWDQRQYISDTSTQRTRKYRTNKELGNVPGTSRERHCDGPDTETDTDIEPPPRGRFCPDDFNPDPDRHKILLETRGDLNFQTELLTFKSHEFPTTKSNWQKAWEKWCLGAPYRLVPGPKRAGEAKARSAWSIVKTLAVDASTARGKCTDQLVRDVVKALGGWHAFGRSRDIDQMWWSFRDKYLELSG